jgi:hypothetical protein
LSERDKRGGGRGRGLLSKLTSLRFFLGASPDAAGASGFLLQGAMAVDPLKGEAKGGGAVSRGRSLGALSRDSYLGPTETWPHRKKKGGRQALWGGTEGGRSVRDGGLRCASWWWWDGGLRR